MKKIKFLVPILALAFVSCDQYLDINDSPNNLTFDKATPSKLLPGAQVSTYRVQVGNMNQLGNVFMNSWTRNVNSFGNGFDKELQLNLDNGFYAPIWDGLYRELKNYQAIIDYPNPSGQYDNYVAAAKICKSFYTQYIVDLYGNAPYSQAWKGSANVTPAYDDDYAIYQALIADLEDARDLIANAPTTVEDITPYDVMLGGDMARWVEFANTVQLRLCLRMSEVTGAKATFRDTKLADIAAGPFLSDNVAINPGWTGATADQLTPMISNYFYNTDQSNLQNRTFIAMTGHAWKSLQSYASTNYPAAGSQEIIAGSGVFYPNVTDPRSARIFTGGIQGTAVGPRRAVNQGSSFVDVAGPTTAVPGPPSRLGALGHINPYDQAGIFSGAAAGFPADFFGVDGFIMTYSESCFLQAEAAVRYPALFSGGQFWFEEGITDSFAFRNAAIGSYIATINAKSNFGWTASTTNAQKLHAIMYQKWIALMGINGIESYIDYTRTGYPLTPLSSNAGQTRKPYRLIYPVSEYVANSANVPAMSPTDPFVINALTPFWVPGAN
ncbi:SusD/RagB family nutrient-binding outer membrane lipoprotein [Flavobacterium sp.]|uniref:SusD/RagB family nutrient-binding outer membrane lipoprotein n=1 Tax=Flavobacterium sp. TaxID=239 RepID=UPI00260F2B3D|nr:SusD/RagB family nutrient-binding outer membrane lipoprotein [Flavobacterium sp.]